MTQYGLTALQRQLFDFVHAEISNGRRAPSFEEIKVRLGLSSKGNVHRIVDGLVERGWLVKLPNKARSLALPGTEVSASVETDPQRGLPLDVTIPPILAGRLRVFCADRRRTAGDVVREALDAHLRWPA